MSKPPANHSKIGRDEVTGDVRKFQCSRELLDDLLGFTERTFYPKQALSFTKDRPRLLKWVLLYPATWLHQRGVTLSAGSYRDLVVGILDEAARLGHPSKCSYLPAYLRQVMQSHLEHHGDDLYTIAKSARSLAENSIILAGKSIGRPPDLVEDLARASRLLQKPKSVNKRVSNRQLNLL